ncbi:MAG: gamma-carboxygeranoyl-CoA hydratase [Legionellales bacterium RIFCSPHIGHO2_12_FULL_35_11]|nr:MAG: gamma-carboxygeranoyl-CoA hydratase [Legionellales bacterium RIFCSPHIGHO2_12_FULL_35_11]
MSNILTEIKDKVLTITLNNIAKHNAFDDLLIDELQKILREADQNPLIYAVILRGNGKHFSAGADLNWMQRMANFSEEENKADALNLANLLSTLYNIKKPTIAVVHGATFGGGLGLIAACDIAIAEPSAKFCFSEVKLGLIPAVISPYVIKAVGERSAKWLFMTAEIFDSQKALEIQLIQYIIAAEELNNFANSLAKSLVNLPTDAVLQAKSLVKEVAYLPIDNTTSALTAERIAKKRVSNEAQTALHNFLNKGNTKNVAKNSNC